ncbi:MAG: gamma-glutamyl-gamma-aminobutyrate hydrolase family protein [Bacteroidetes bacterium]|nr:gamma-glutamyl-gamma-aminobutyrate hydrolase family protein [Bacteroidota bacterium]
MILIVDFGSSKVSQIHEAVDEIMDCETVLWTELQKESISKYQGIILSGAPKLITEIDLTDILSSFKFIKETEIPVLGICFGHQLIGILHGAFGSKMREDRDWQDIEKLEDNILFKNLPNPVLMTEDHCETISIPPNFILLASSDACVNEAMKHPSKDIFGVQFHPETSGNLGYKLIHNFCNLCLEKAKHIEV